MPRRDAARLLTDLDPAVAMVRALGGFLRGRDHRGLPVGPGSARLADLPPAPSERGRRRARTPRGHPQGVPLDQVRRVSTTDLDRWVVRQYGPGPHPAVVVGAPSGAALHLAAALRAPFLPQTLPLSLRDDTGRPDEPAEVLAAIAPSARLVAARNPDLTVHHLHDPAQDRLLLAHTAQLRLKKHRLGPVYERFLEQCLAPDATLVELDCTHRWRTHTTGTRTCFQFGSLGGLTEEEYHLGGPRITRCPSDQGAPRDHWRPPAPDTRRPEAAWGYDPALGEDLRRTADALGYPLRRLVYPDPQDLSPFVADLYRWWYRRRGLPGDRLLGQTSAPWDPLWTLRLGAVPFWLLCHLEPSHQALAAYLADGEPFDVVQLDLSLHLCSHDPCPPGVVPVAQWRELAAFRARRVGETVGVDERAHPADAGSAPRVPPALRALPPRHSLPAPLPVSAVDAFWAQAPRRYRARWC